MTLKQLAKRAAPKARQLFCLVVNGGHELHRARTDDRIYQRCLCGYETRGWKIDRRDRQLALVLRAR